MKKHKAHEEKFARKDTLRMGASEQNQDQFQNNTKEGPIKKYSTDQIEAVVLDKDKIPRDQKNVRKRSSNGQISESHADDQGNTNLSNESQSCWQSMKQTIYESWIFLINYLQFDRMITHSQIEELKKQEFIVRTKYEQNYVQNFEQRSKKFGITIEQVIKLRQQQEQSRGKNFWTELKRFVCCEGGNQLQETDEMLTAVSQSQYITKEKKMKNYNYSHEKTEQNLLENYGKQKHKHKPNIFDVLVQNEDYESNKRKTKNQIDLTHMKTIQKQQYSTKEGKQSRNQMTKEGQNNLIKSNNLKFQTVYIKEKKNEQDNDKIQSQDIQILDRGNTKTKENQNITIKQATNQIKSTEENENRSDFTRNKIYGLQSFDKRSQNVNQPNNNLQMQKQIGMQSQLKTKKDTTQDKYQSKQSKALQQQTNRQTNRNNNSTINEQANNYSYIDQSKGTSHRNNIYQQESIANNGVQNNSALQAVKINQANNHRSNISTTHSLKPMNIVPIAEIYQQQNIKEGNQNDKQYKNVQQGFSNDQTQKSNDVKRKTKSKRNIVRGQQNGMQNASNGQNLTNPNLENLNHNIQFQERKLSVSNDNVFPSRNNQNYHNNDNSAYYNQFNTIQQQGASYNLASQPTLSLNKFAVGQQESSPQLAKKRKARNKKMFNLKEQEERQDEVIIFPSTQQENYHKMTLQSRQSQATMPIRSQDDQVSNYSSSQTSIVKKRKKVRRLKDFALNDGIIVIQANQIDERDQNVPALNQQDAASNSKVEKKKKKKTMFKEEMQKAEYQLQQVDLGDLNQ